MSCFPPPLQHLVKTVFRGALVLTLCAGFSGEAAAKSKSKTNKTKARPRVARAVSAAPSVSGRYADLVIDAQTGRIIFETNSTAPRHPASLTKMMTLYLAFQAIERGQLRLDTLLPVSAHAASQSPSKLGLRAGQTIRAYDAIMGLITESANDAAVVLAEAIGGSTNNFAQIMVQQAQALGMRQTIFKNPNGLPDPNQITTARDMAALGYGLIYHFPGFYPYFSRNNFSYKGRIYNNHNNLMKRYDGMDGIKTGYIRASGFNIVTSAVRGSTRLIGVIFGGTSAPARDRQMESLLDQAFAKHGDPDITQASYIPLPSKSAVLGQGRRMASTYRVPDNVRMTEVSAAAKPEVLEWKVMTPQQGGGAWGIQVGAYSEVEAAQTALNGMARSLGSLLEGAEPSIQKITMTDGSAMYRARFIGLTETTARTSCSHLVKRGQGCLVVSEP